jgi:predicted unusual protein kinase regulating ubiquinone biosynthesis (AarF/ABC1/UbiB family)
VAVKVRHPEVDKYIQRDVNIMFGISKFLSIFSKSFEIPIGEGSLKKTLIDQIDFNIEKDNLIIFKKHFTNNKSVDFPEAFENETRDSILI